MHDTGLQSVHPLRGRAGLHYNSLGRHRYSADREFYQCTTAIAMADCYTSANTSDPHIAVIYNIDTASGYSTKPTWDIHVAQAQMETCTDHYMSVVLYSSMVPGN